MNEIKSTVIKPMTPEEQRAYNQSWHKQDEKDANNQSLTPKERNFSAKIAGQRAINPDFKADSEMKK